MATNEYDDDQTREFTNLTSGTKISHYTIVSKIGAGGMGEVYLAEDRSLKRQVALKFMPAHIASYADMRARFTREAQASAKLDHPNIVPIYEVGEFQGRPFFAMAYIDGKSLKEVIKKSKLSISETIEYTKQICEGLNKAHESGVVHRDIKPGNIIVDKDNKPRILDFGLASISGAEKLTKTGSTLGTVGYMSPEQIEGNKVDHRSDLFSVGVILYEMLTNRRPFEGDTDAAVFRSITDNTPEPIARYKSGTTGELQQIVDKALSKDPSLRYQHADDMVTDFNRLLGNIKSNLESQRKVLAVLPFQNLGLAEDEYFADGMTDEIITKLSGVQDLSVIARSSIMQYKDTKKTIEQISNELNADYILEGTIRWQKKSDHPDMIRVTPKLIKTSQSIQIWADNYDDELSEVFKIQTKIANKIIGQLKISLPSKEVIEFNRKLTENTEAYHYFLRGNFYRSGDDSIGNLKKAREMYEKAILADSNFVEAYIALARVYLIDYYQWNKKDENLLLKAKKYLDIAVGINSDLSIVQSALSRYYRLSGKSELAIQAMEYAYQLDPNSQAIISEKSHYMRIQGRFSESIKLYKEALKQNPNNPKITWSLGWTLSANRNYQEADKLYGLSLSILPEQKGFMDHYSWNTLLWKGDVEKSFSILEGINKNSEYYDMVHYQKVRLYLCQRNFEKSLEVLEDAPERICTHRWDHFYRSPKSFLIGLVNWVKGDFIEAQNSFKSVIPILENDLENDPKTIRIISNLGISYAGINRYSDAIQYGLMAVEKIPISKDAIYGVLPIFDLIIIYMMTKEHDLALDHIEQLLEHPCDEFSTLTLRIDPLWDPLRENPRFESLIEKYDK